MKKIASLFIYTIIVFGNVTFFEAFAQAGSLDTTFANGGIATTIFGGGYGQCVKIQPDKKIIVAGGGYQGSIYGVGLIRYHSNGSIDSTFGTSGKVYTDVGGISSWGNEFTLQADGKIVVAGLSNTRSSGLFGGNIQNFLVARYNTNGSLDNTFGNNGTVVTGFNQKNAQAGSLAIQSDGKIVVSGVVDGGTNAVSYDFAIVRYNVDGTLDNAFGNAGKVITDFNGGNDIGNCIRLQTDGKIVVAGPVGGDPSGTYYAMARYNTDGSLDNTFGSAGKVTTSVTGGDDAAYFVEIQNDGKFLVCGTFAIDKVPHVGLIKYNSDGSVDSLFGNGGKVATYGGNAESRAYTLATQPDGKILVSGIAADSSKNQKMLLTMRYLGDGTLDTIFGTGGKVRTAIGSKDDAGYSIALQADKKIVVACWTKDNNDNYNYAVVRYNGDCDPPLITTNLPQTICAGTSISLTGSGGNSYSWSGGVTDGVGFVPTEGVHTYTVVGTDLANCKDSTTTTITVNALPLVTSNASGEELCAGSLVTLTGSGANTYVWSDNVIDGQAFAPTTSNTYTLTGSNDNGCSAMDTIRVNVNSIPLIIANINSNTICSGDSIVLSGSSNSTNGPINYSWTNNVNDAIPFAASNTQTYTVTGTDSNSCSGSDSIRVFVNPAPNVNGNSTDTILCSGASIILWGTSTNEQMNYTWTGAVLDSVSFIPNAGVNTYTVIGTDSTNCSASNTISITVNALPDVIANTSKDSICSGSLVTLTGSGANTFSWSDSIIDGLAFAPLSSQTYTVSGTDDNGCSGLDTVRVSVNASPIIVARVDQNVVCIGDSIVLSGSSNSTNFPINYTWTDNVMDATPFAPVTNQTYTLTGTDNNGCLGIDSIAVFVNPIPKVNATSSDKSLCSGASVVLSGTSTTAPMNYTWTNNVNDGIAFVPSSTQTYTLTGSDSIGCSSFDTITVWVNTASVQTAVTAIASKDSICEGSEVTLTGQGADSYFWSDNVVDGVAFVPSATHTYTLTGNFNNGCSSTLMKTVVVNKLPSISIDANTLTVCSGTSVTLSGEGATSYNWSHGIVDGVAFVPVSSRTYTVTGTDSNNCSASANAAIQVFSLPKVGAIAIPSSTICLGDSILLVGTGADNYSWSNTILDGIPFFPTSTKNYTVIGRDEYNCTNTYTQLVTVDSCLIDPVGIGAPELEYSKNRIVVFPNPNKGDFIVSLRNTAGHGETISTFFIINELGQAVKAFTLNDSNFNSMKIENLEQGIYLMVGRIKNEIVKEKIIVLED